MFDFVKKLFNKKPQPTNTTSSDKQKVVQDFTDVLKSVSIEKSNHREQPHQFGVSSIRPHSATPAPRRKSVIQPPTINQPVPTDNSNDFATSMLIAATTDNALLGAVVGGSLSGGLVGGMMGSMIHDSSEQTNVQMSVAEQPTERDNYSPSYSSVSDSDSSSSYDHSSSSSYDSSSSSSSWD